MKFLVRRASGWLGGDVFVDEAKHEEFNYNGRTLDLYYVDINTLEELMAFENKYGRLVIGDNIFDDRHKQILIYDDYIE